MSISSIGNPTLQGVLYDFTNMTPQQLLNAGGNLYQEGKITNQQNITLMGLACAYAPVSGSSPSVNLGLNSTTGQNYIGMLQNNISELESLGGLNAGEQKALAGDQSLLQVFSAYQDQNPTSTAAQGTTGTLVDQQA